MQNCSDVKRLQAGKILQCRTTLLRSGYKQEKFNNAELLYEDVEENDILV
jgi:hypothetical protein